MKIEDYINHIKLVNPELTIEDYEINNVGQNNDVLIINHSLVFRFPKYQQGIARLKEETLILEMIKYSTPLPIPYPEYQCFTPIEVGKVFTGYELIKGSPLWKDDFKQVKDEGVLARLAEQLVGFLVNIHTTPTEALVAESEDIHQFFTELYYKFREKLYPFMRKDAKEKVSRNFEDYLQNEKNRNLRPKLIHGDFGASNILWNPELGEITGIIDFGGSGLGDPAYDLAGILSSYGEDFFNRCIALYPGGSEVADRVKFYRSTFALQEALHGIENDDPQAFENGIKDYR